MTDETEAAAAAGKAAGAKGKNKGAGAGGKAKGDGKGGGKGKAAEAGGGDAAKAKAKTEGQIARLLVRAVWLQEWSAANPEGKAEDRKEAWKAARDGAIEKHMKPYRRALNMLSRSGVTMTYQAPTAKGGSEGDDEGGED